MFHAVVSFAESVPTVLFDRHLPYIQTSAVGVVGKCERSTPRRHSEVGNIRHAANCNDGFERQEGETMLQYANRSSTGTIPFIPGLRMASVRRCERIRDSLTVSRRFRVSSKGKPLLLPVWCLNICHRLRGLLLSQCSCPLPGRWPKSYRGKYRGLWTANRMN